MAVNTTYQLNSRQEDITTAFGKNQIFIASGKAFTHANGGGGNTPLTKSLFKDPGVGKKVAERDPDYSNNVPNKYGTTIS